jgi:glyoxylate/hydroxypyruvate reductase A
MKQILVEADVRDQKKFASLLRISLSEFEIFTDYSTCDPSCVEYVVFWRIFPRYIKDITNLKALLVCGSGIDHLDIPINIESKIPLIRLVDPFLKLNVARYVENQLYNLDQLTKRKTNNDFKRLIGILGRGQIGNFLVEYLSERSYEVRTWSKHSKNQNVNKNFYGYEDLDRFLSGIEVLICALPLTNETKNILNSQLFAKLDLNCYLINIGRSGHLDEQALIHALDASKIIGASLDFIEPFSSIVSLSDAQRKNLRLTITPHIAGYISAETQAPEAIKQILNLENGYMPDAVVNFNLNY